VRSFANKTSPGPKRLVVPSPEADLNLALKSDHVLLRRCIVPVAEITGLRATKGYTLVLLKRRSLGAFAGCIRRRDLLEVRLPSGPVYM
jgi:hypothetical protein